MEQHPIPQNISSYQFRLVGDMTLKQFFQIAGGALISLIIYSLPIHPIIKWPFIIFFSLFGAALAFLPFQERPLEQWILAFFRSIYSPTVFKWRSTTGEEFFLGESAPPVQPEVQEAPKAEAANIPFVNKLEETEGRFLGKLADIFRSTGAPAFTPAIAATQPTPYPAASPTATDTFNQVPSSETGARETVIPQTGFVAVPKMIVEESSPQMPSNPLTATAVSQTLTGQGLTASQAAQFSPDAAPPYPPTIPNTIAGQVMDPEGKIVEGAILEVLDSAGRPVRALRTNKAGHFLTVTSLVNGKYELVTEKEGFVFEPIVLDATGNIIAPIAIRAKGRSIATHEA